MNNNILSPGRIAKICNVAPRTVCKWIDRGILKGYRMPGGFHRRVTTEDFEAFIARDTAAASARLVGPVRSLAGEAAESSPLPAAQSRVGPAGSIHFLK